VPPRRQGQCFRTRCADDFLIGCAREADARRVMAVLPKRFARFRLTIQPAKTAFMACKRPPRPAPSARGTGSCALLGFTHSWAKTRRGDWGIKRKTVGKRLRRCRRALWTGCRDNRHTPLHEQSQPLCLKLRGSYPYYGSRGNCKMLAVVCEPTERAWRYGLSRRSHQGHRRWQKLVVTVDGRITPSTSASEPRVRAFHARGSAVICLLSSAPFRLQIPPVGLVICGLTPCPHGVSLPHAIA